MPPTAPPEFLRYSPADIIKMGRERGTAPEQIAQAVTKHRDNLTAYGMQTYGERFNEALPRLQQETNTALEELKPGFGVGDTLSGIGSMLGGLPTTVPAAYYGVTEGFTRPDQYSPEARAAFDANAAYQQRMQQESQQRLERGEATSTGDAFRSAGPSLGGTVGSMAAAIPAGMAAGALVGTAIEPVGGTAAGGLVGAAASGLAAAAGAGTVAYRMAGQQFLDDAFKALQKQRGGQMSEAEMQQAYNELLPLAENSALWEAGPEAIGNAVSLGTAKIVFGLGKPLLTNLAKTALGKVGVKGGAIAGSQAVELGGETTTALGQGVTQAQADAYARGDANWRQARSAYDRPGGTLQALKDIAPATLALGATTLGAGGVVKLATLPFQKPNDSLPPNQTPAPTGTPQTPGATPGAAPLAGGAGAVPSTLSRIAQESLVPDLPEDTGELTADEVADLEGVGQTMSDPSTTPPTQTPLTPGERAPADQIAQNAIAGVTAEPAQTITGSNVQTGTEMPVPSPTAPADAGTGAMVAAPQVGDVVNYEGYAGRLQQDGQRLVVEVPNGPVIEVSDPETVQRAVGETAQQVRLAELQAMPDPQVSEAQFIPAEDGTLSLRDNNGNTYVPHNDQLLRSVRMNEQGQVEVLLRNLKRPGQVIKLTGQQAEQAQDAILAAAINVEQQGGTVRYGTSRGLQNLQGGNRSNAGSTTLPSAAADALVNLASAAVRAGQTFAQWATSMLQRFGEAVRQYLQGAWQAAMRTSEVGAVDIFNGKVRGMTTSAVEVLHNDSTTLAKPKSKVSNDEVAKALQDAAVEQWGEIITSDNITPEQEAILVANGTDEFVAAFRASGKTAADWYTTNIESAMAVANVIHEELKSDQAAQAVKVNGQPIFRNKEDAQLALYLAMAITSQNLNVNQNTTYAEEQFQIFKATGKFDTSRLYGEKAKSISANLDLANNVLKELGWQDLHQIIKTTYTVRELSSILSKWTGKNVKIAGRLGDQVQGAAIFGPKIGQGFLQNLMGNYLPVTIDLWMRRTWGRWTGDVLGDGLTGERLARLIDEVRNIGLPLPTSLARMRPVVRKTEKGKSFRTMSEEFMDRVEVEEDLREQLNDYAKEIVTAWGRKYNAVQSGITKAQMDGLLTGTMSMDAVATTTLRNEESLNTQWEAKANKPKGKGAKETWKAAQRVKRGRSYKLTTDQWNGTVNGVKNVGPKLKPQWALAANVIRTQLKPIDAPSDQDRAVISRIVNKIRVELEAQGITVSNADIQAVLWYPEKDLWAKLRGEEESNLKQSYEDEFLKLARERGIGIEAEAAAARVRAARTGGPADQNTNGGISQGSVSAGKTQGGGFKNLNVSGRTAGFLNTDILNEATDLLRSGITDFANWSRAMVSRFGRAIQEFLAGIWQQVTSPQTNAAQNVRMGRAQGTAPVTLGNSGAVLNPAAAPSRAAAAPNETQSRFASPNEAARVINGPRTDAMVADQARRWLDSVDTQTAVEQFVAQAVPLPLDAAEHAAALLISRLTSESTTNGTEVQRLWAHVQSQRMARVWIREFLSADPARALRQRGVVNNTILQPIAPVMAAQGILVDRADAVMDKRFEGGGAGAVEKVTKIVEKVDAQTGTDVAADLDADTEGSAGTPARPNSRKGAVKAKHPNLKKLLDALRKKMLPGMTWSDIFMDLPSTQKERQRQIYARLLKDERLRNLNADERLALTNELDKAWQRERRKVFNRELEKAGVLGEKDKTDRVKVQKALPKLLRMINLGMFNSEMWREAVAPEYGLRMLTAADTAQLRTLAEAAWKLPEGVIRNQKLRDLLNAIQKKTGASWIEVLNSYWTAAVLSGLRTQFDTWLAAINGMGTNLMQIGGLMARGQGRAAIDAHAQWWRGLFEGVRESGQILFKGDTSYLKRFGADLKKALEGETNVTPVPLGENLWKNGNTFQKYGLAPVMMFTGRLMAAADHINNTATTQGAIAVARALHPELYQGRVGFTASERADARTQALREVTGGAAPKTSQERATVSARTREILNGTVKPADYAAASEIGDMAAYQNDPTGVFGIIYSAMKQGLGSIQRGLGDYAQDVTANRFYRVISGVMAGSLHGITGTRFMRFGANFGADLTRYIPGSYVLGKAGFYGRDVSRMQQELLLGKNLVGLMLASTLAAIFLNSDDEDEGWQIEGDWSTLNPQQAKERMAAGYERLTMWKREGGKVRRVSYKQWPTMGLFAVVGGMLDEKRHKPASWAERGTAGHLLRGVATGYTQVKNVSAVRNLVELFGEPSFSSDKVTSTIDQMIKTGTGFAGGFMPTLIKDAEAWTDPRNFKPEGAAELMLRSMPIARKFVNDGRPQLNLLGEEVKLQRTPWSRAYTSVESGEAHRVLGALLARGLSLPMPSDQVTVIKDNVRVPLETLGRDAVWRYEKAVGQGYKDWLSLEGSDLLKLPVQEADARIKARSAAIKARAKTSVVK